MSCPHPVSRRSLLARFRESPTAVGTTCCIVAALGYGGVNVCLRALTVRCDRGLILFAKEAMAFACVAMWLALRRRRDDKFVPGWRTVAGLTVVGVLTQMAATLPFLWAMAVVGLAIAVTLSLGCSLVSSAVLGRIFLGERVSGQSLLAIGLLIGAVGFLTFGAEGGAAAVSAIEEHGRWSVLLATAVACLAGTIYGLLNVSIRGSVTGGVSPGFVAVIIPVTGVICLAPTYVGRLVLGNAPTFSGTDILVLLIAGSMNVVAWFAFIQGLKTTRVVHANVLTASQVAMAAIAGVVFFEESASPALLTGVAMTIAGMVSIDRPSTG